MNIFKKTNDAHIRREVSVIKKEESECDEREEEDVCPPLELLVLLLEREAVALPRHLHIHLAKDQSHVQTAIYIGKCYHDIVGGDGDVIVE